MHVCVQEWSDSNVKLTVVGASPSYPNPGSPSSGYLVEEGSSLLLVDCGHGVAGKVMGLVPLAGISSILISHMHPDHYFDLVPLTYAYKSQSLPPIPLWLPPEGRSLLSRLQDVVGLPPAFFAEMFDVNEYDPEGSLSCGDIGIRFAATRHFVPGFAMRFEISGSTNRSLLFSSDTSWTEPVVRLAHRASVGLVEAALESGASQDDRQGHMTPREAAGLARQAEVCRLLITHYPRESSEALLAEARSVFGGNVALAEEGKVYEI
ncbi:MAG: MBL fold metallo-hydrolase [Chloroflexota bacterium]